MKHYTSGAPRHRTLARLALLLVVGASEATQAEKADKDQPVNIEADKLSIDDIKKESVFEGNVVFTQGTLMLKADRVVVRQDPQGFNYGFAFGKPAYFRQKREGFDEYVEGNAERLEYDGRQDKVQLFANAYIRKGQDEVRGDYISYDAVTEFYQVIGGGKPAATPTNPAGRVQVTIQPRKSAQPAPDKPQGDKPQAGKPQPGKPDSASPPADNAPGPALKPSPPPR
jgi:lipopolysaccharide export system protein LptA